MTTNCIKFECANIKDAKGVASIFGIDFTADPVLSVNPMALTHRVLGVSRVVSWSNAVASGGSRTMRSVSIAVTCRSARCFTACFGTVVNQRYDTLPAAIPWKAKGGRPTNPVWQLASPESLQL